MKILFCERPNQMAYADKEMPEVQTGESLIKIKRIGICGTDLHAFKGEQPFVTYPRILGHELSGELVNPNNAEGFEKGELVTIIPYYNCGHCIACSSGKPNCCVDIKVCGVHIDGGMAEYLCVPHYALVHGIGLGYDALALVEPLAIGAHSVRRAAIQPGEFVLVIGAGPIGLGTMEFARIAGGNVIAMDINNDRLAFCQNKLGITHIINAATDDIMTKMREITHGNMPTVIIDCTGSLVSINKAFQYLAHGGRYVLTGLQKNEITFSHPEFHKREATLMSSRNATRVDFEHVIDAIKKGLVQPTNYITHRAPFDQVANKMNSWTDPTSGIIKAMIDL